MTEQRRDHGAVLLDDGQVMVSGGFRRDYKATASVEFWTPGSGRWQAGPRMTTARGEHALVLLKDGRVLAIGGASHNHRDDRSRMLSTAEVFDPRTNAWRALDPLPEARTEPEAVRLRDGRVLVVGGIDGRGCLQHGTIWNPRDGRWRQHTNPWKGRCSRRALVLADGRVLIAGYGQPGGLEGDPGATIWDPVVDKWQEVPDLVAAVETPRRLVSLADGSVLVSNLSNRLAVWNPRNRSVVTLPAPMPVQSSLTGLPREGALWTYGDNAFVLDVRAGTWRPFAPLIDSVARHTVTPLSDGRILIAGGHFTQPMGQVWDGGSRAIGRWVITRGMAANPSFMKAGLLPDGRVIVAGGLHETTRAREEISSADRQSWSALRPLAAARTRHALTILPDGRALVTGGATGGETHRRGLRARVTGSMSRSDGVARATEVWDPRTGAWSAGGDMLEPRLDHSATALLDGRVLVAGGAHMVWATHSGVATKYANAFPRPVATAEIWNPSSRGWQAVGPLSAPRRRHTATRLRDGRVLIAGGTGEYVGRDDLDDHPPLATAELFDPATGRWSPVAPMGRPRFGHAATLLQDGRVLVIGPATSVEIWDPGSGRWTEGPSLNLPRRRPEAVTLSDGRVLVAGGPENCSGSTDVSEVLDQAATRWQVTPPFRLKRCHPALVALPDGRAMALGSLLHGAELKGRDAWPGEIWMP